ncbi:MAG: DUF5691 domain-containing protein, partial [Bifidobacteriaceae bacterium]|nr:DUF5691 domain-containing protein [Bifidobacteriaceae bacterium]
MSGVRSSPGQEAAAGAPPSGALLSGVPATTGLASGPVASALPSDALAAGPPASDGAGSAHDLGDLASAYAALVDCWLVGGDAQALAPAEWAGLVEGMEPPVAELTLVALAGQFDSVALRPAKPAGAVRRPPLPPLAAPPVPEKLRPVLRAALTAAPSAEAVIRMVARRGFTVHPADWFPPRSVEQVGGSEAEAAGLPELYLPWLAWSQGAWRQQAAGQAEATGGASAGAGPAARINTAEVDAQGDWRLLRPAERAAAFERLRRSDPPASREVLRQQFKVLAAAGRAALLKSMATGLSPEDAELLAELKTDRSSAVRSQAEAFLARLGLADNSADAQELADFFQVTVKGLVAKRTQVAPAPVKTDAARNRRGELFQRVSLPQLAAALGLEADGLVEAWQTRPGKSAVREADAVNRDFAALVARTGSDAVAEGLALKLIEDSEAGGAANAAIGLLGRLGPEAAAKVVRANLEAGPTELELLAGATDQDLIDPADALWLAPPELVAQELAKEAGGASAPNRPAASGPKGRRDGLRIWRLTASATMMTAEAAQVCLDQLAYLGVHRG